MTERTLETSPQAYARISACFYLLTIFAAPFALFARNTLIVSGNSAATAANILAHESLFRAAYAADLLATAAYIGVTALFYRLFRPVNRSLSLLAAFLSLVGCALGAVASLFSLAPLAVLGPAPYLSSFQPEQARSLAYLLLKLNGQAFNVGIVFFGFYCLLIGYLAFRSAFLPRFLGALMALPGVGWLTFLWPPLALAVTPFNQACGAIGEISFTLWLLVKGVNNERWKQQAAAASY